MVWKWTPRFLVSALSLLSLASFDVSAQVTTSPALFQLDPNFVITDVPTTRTYDFVVSLESGAPDGFNRTMLVINGQFPAPVIEANEGDTVIINVQNNLPTGTGIHWHGILQNGTDWADGVPGFTQCPIPAGQSFQYKFTLNNQWGSYWYHSHMGNTMADGLIGAFVIHSVNEPISIGVDYDVDQVIMLSDWMHDLSDLIVDDLLSGNGYRGAGVPPAPDAFLLNGVGQFNCSTVTTTCTTTTIPDIVVLPDTRYRFRVVNSGVHALYKFSIDDHPLTVIAADGIDLVPVSGVHQLPVALAQRYDVIVTTNVSTTADAAFYVRAAPCLSCVGTLTTTYTTALAALRYTAAGATPATAAPTSSDWSDSVDTETSFADWPDSNLVPAIATNAPTTVLDSVILSSKAGNIANSAGKNVGHYFWNSVTWSNYIYQPLLFQVQAGESLNASAITSHTFTSLGGADIIVNNLDAALDHPYHLHGNPFFIVARGTGALTAATYSALTFKTTNPPSRDVTVIGRGGYAVLRIITDNPGVWPLHCHIGWHLAVGKMAAIVVRPDGIAAQVTPSAATGLCDASNIPDGDAISTIAPGKKRSVWLPRQLWVEGTVPRELLPSGPAHDEVKRSARWSRRP